MMRSAEAAAVKAGIPRPFRNTAQQSPNSIAKAGAEATGPPLFSNGNGGLQRIILFRAYPLDEKQVLRTLESSV